MIALLVFLVSGAWGACTPYDNYSWTSGGHYNSCLNNKPSNVFCSGMKALTYYCQSAGTTCTSCFYRSPGNMPTSGCAGSLYSQGCYWQDCYRCDSQCEGDSVLCIGKGEGWQWKGCELGCVEACSDSTWYNCTSVFTENNVIRSQITEYDCDSVTATRYVLGSCNENGFCEGSQVSGVDTCSYPTPDPKKCKSGGQNGSLCTYVCPDGKLHSCHIAWTPGQPSEYQNCPSTPPSDCVTPRPSSSSSNDSLNNLPDPPYTESSSSVSPEPDPDCPECDYLQEIRDTLHRANEQRRFANYLLDSIKSDVGGFGAQFNSIISNTAVTVNRLNTSNSSLSTIASTNTQIADKLNSLDLDNITATVDSVVVHVDVSRDTVPWYFTADLDSLPVWRDTISETNRLIRDINSQVDMLVQDSAGDNILKKFLPYVKKTFDKIEDFYSGYTLPAMLDSLSGRLGLDTVSIAEENDIKDKVIPLGDSAYIDGNFYCEEHPDAAVCVELDSSELSELVGPDTVDANEFFRVQDSILESNKAFLDSMKKRDTTPDTLGLDELAGDSAKIREKLDFLFLPQNTLEQCFDFRLNTTLGKWTYNLFIDFADLFGLDLCDLIRKIVRILTFILIVFTTIKGYIRAFGGGGSGGDV